MTAQEIFNISMNLIDVDPTNATETLTYQTKSINLINLIQNDICKTAPIYKTLDIPMQSVTPINSIIDYKEHNEEDEILESTVAKAYSFDIIGPATVYVEDTIDSITWNILDTLTIANTVTTYTNYKGSILPTIGAVKTRIRFSGSYFYTYTNVALYKENFYTVPKFGSYKKVELPTDFLSIYKVYEEYTPGQYRLYDKFKLENTSDLYIPYEFKGNIRLVYRFIPTFISELTETIAFNDQICSTVIATGLAFYLFINENTNVANFYNQQYEVMKSQIKFKQPVGISNKKDYYDAKLSF